MKNHIKTPNENKVLVLTNIWIITVFFFYQTNNLIFFSLAGKLWTFGLYARSIENWSNFSAF